jgi:hypothetical protein
VNYGKRTGCITITILERAGGDMTNDTLIMIKQQRQFSLFVDPKTSPIIPQRTIRTRCVSSSSENLHFASFLKSDRLNAQEKSPLRACEVFCGKKFLSLREI